MSQRTAAENSRFVIQGDTVHDTKTNLTWMRCSQGQRWTDDGGCVGTPKKFSFPDANREWGDGWRMPSKEELLSIVAPYCSSPSIDEAIFPGTFSGRYWTSTKIGSDCWRVGFIDGQAYSHDPFYGCRADGAVRLVRGEP